MKIFLTLLCTSVLFSAVAYAASSDNACEIIGEEIIPLRVPNFDVPILWKRVTGVDGPDIPVDLISLADGGFVVVGESAEYDKDKGMGKNQSYLARVDINGKILWEKRYPVKGFVHASHGIAVKDRLVVLSAIDEGKGKSVRLDFMDGLGVVKTSKTISDPVYDLIPEGIASLPNSPVMTIALWASNRKDLDDNFTILKQVTAEGKEISSRHYLPGLPNRLESFQKTVDGDLIGSGQIRENGVNAGWIFNVDGPSGDLKFQRPYLRGYQSNLRAIAQDTDGSFIAIGDSVPTDAGLRAAWVMKVSDRGNPIWQRYIQGKYAFSGRDVSVAKDGRIIAMVNARPVAKEGGREHVRLMTFTPEGKLEGDEALIEGANAQGVDLLVREHSRILTGVTTSGLGNYGLAKDQRTAGYDIWMLGLPKLSAFQNPCGARKVSDSFDEGL
ncbi:MAG: hypothetical protein DI586_09655 [Micavibrio aeruginosavorus]|uniref:Phytase-like domain-containing protein n=1 Tax=Micavibrio aeruginosavorus TaxID=349221 RepID=A0A2W5HFZ8_9BACT|nr:MAG: hypothetical protein DI586_09655 [Micavibrio aeruginosavorus]